MLEGLRASWRLLGRICFLAFLIASYSCISSIPWLLTPCQQLHHSKLSFIITASPTLLLLPYKNHYDYIEPIRTVMANL